MFPLSGRCISVLALTGLLASSPVLAKQQRSDGPSSKLQSFFPTATSVEVQRQCGALPSAHNTAVFATLDGQGLARLRSVTGQQALAAISDGRNQVLLRDDGVAPDERAGDGRFSFLTTLDLAEVYTRAQAESRAARAGKLDGLTVFSGRQVVGKQSLAPFDLNGFMNCQTVPLTQTPVNLNTVTVTDPEDWVFLGFSIFSTLAEPMAWSGLALEDPTRTVNPCGLFSGTGTGTSTTGNPDGPWTFKTLMTQMAGATPPADFVENWLTLYTQDQTTTETNGFTVEAVSHAQQFIDRWRDESGGGDLDLNISPFRLLAITPRVDLRQGAAGGYGSPPGPTPNAGELRFIFGAVDPMTCNPMDFSVIFEYGVPLTSCVEIRDWARDWLELSEDLWDSGTEEEYASALQALTDQITTAGADPSKPNGSALNQLRSNELSLGNNNAWRIREYHLQPSGQLEQATTAETPDRSFVFTNFEYFDALISDASINSVPANFGTSTLPTLPFLGAEARVSFTSQTAWGFFSNLDFSNSVLAERRHKLALNTCDGCHSVETQTSNAHMLDPQPLSSSIHGILSGFLVGGNPTFPTLGEPHVVTDPITGQERSFFDLERRLLDMQSLANSFCGPVVALDALMAEAPALTH